MRSSSRQNRRRRMAKLVMFLGSIVGIGYFATMMYKSGVGHERCSVSYTEARRALFRPCALPPGGSRYSVVISVRVVQVIVEIDESALRRWLVSNDATIGSPGSLIQGVPGVCEYESWVITNGWKARVRRNGVVTSVFYDSDRHLAYVVAH